MLGTLNQLPAGLLGGSSALALAAPENATAYTLASNATSPLPALVLVARSLAWAGIPPPDVLGQAQDSSVLQGEGGTSLQPWLVRMPAATAATYQNGGAGEGRRGAAAGWQAGGGAAAAGWRAVAAGG